MNAPVALVTGALAGIGRATAIAFAREGYRVVISGRNEKVGKELADQLNAQQGRAAFIQADVRKEADHQRLVDSLIERFGRLDVAVNNAGTEGQPGPISAQTAETYAVTFDTNVLGVLLGMKHQLRVMVPQGRGSIVNITSVFGRVGGAYASVYVASKHAVEGLTKSAALEVVGSGVRVNSVAPGPVQTATLDRFVGNEENKAGLVSTVPLKRTALPEEIAEAIVFVASDKASYMTGQSLLVDGGRAA